MPKGDLGVTTCNTLLVVRHALFVSPTHLLHFAPHHTLGQIAMHHRLLRRSAHRTPAILLVSITGECDVSSLDSKSSTWIHVHPSVEFRFHW